MSRVSTHRADGVANALERRGIQATYELHDRVLSTPPSLASLAERSFDYAGSLEELDEPTRFALT